MCLPTDCMQHVEVNMSESKQSLPQPVTWYYQHALLSIWHAHMHTFGHTMCKHGLCPAVPSLEECMKWECKCVCVWLGDKVATSFEGIALYTIVNNQQSCRAAQPSHGCQPYLCITIIAQKHEGTYVRRGWWVRLEVHRPSLAALMNMYNYIIQFIRIPCTLLQVYQSVPPPAGWLL